MARYGPGAVSRRSLISTRIIPIAIVPASDPILLYGATGYTGRLILAEAVRQGLHPILCGRDAAALAALAEQYGLDYRVARLGDPYGLQHALRDVRVVLHTAGPFSQTAAAMVDACLQSGTHYLDIGGEAAVIDALTRRHAEARRRQIMIMPGAGFDVVPSDCLAAHVAAQLPRAQRLAIGVRGLRLASRGSAKTFIEQAGREILVRRGGLMASVAPGALEHAFDYGEGPQPSVNVTWGDVVTAFYTTGIPNIEVYFESSPLFRTALMASRVLGWPMTTASWQIWMKLHTQWLPDGPSAAERAAVETVIVAEAMDAHGRCVRARLHTPQAYTFTADVAPRLAARALRGDLEVGFQTPARVYGADFVLSLPQVRRENRI